MQRLSDALGTGLDAKTLRIVVELCELGVNPEAVAEAVLFVREKKERAARRAAAAAAAAAAAPLPSSSSSFHSSSSGFGFRFT